MTRILLGIALLAALAGRAWAEGDDDLRFRSWKAGAYGYLDARGKEVIEARFSAALDFADGVACVEEDGRAQFVDLAGQRVFKKVALETCASFSGGLALVRLKKGNAIAYLGRDGKVAFTPKLKKEKPEDAGDFADGLAPVRMGAKWGYVDAKGAWIVPPSYGPDVDWKQHKKQLAKLDKDPEAYQRLYESVDLDSARAFAGGRAMVKVGGKWGYIDTTGALVIAPQFDDAWPFSEQTAVVEVGGKLGLIDDAGAWLVEPAYSVLYGMSEGLLAARDDAGWRYIDKTGARVVALDAKVSHAAPFSEGFAAVETVYDGLRRRGYIDKAGKIVIKPEFTSAGPFRHGLAEVSKNPTGAYIDRSGTAIWIAPDQAGAWKK